MPGTPEVCQCETDLFKVPMTGCTEFPSTVKFNIPDHLPRFYRRLPRH